MAEKIKDFRWRYQRPLDSRLGILLDYIQTMELHPTITKNEMIIKALSAYYLPKAHSVAGQSPEKIQEIAYESVLALQSEIERLVCEFELDRSKLGIGSEVGKPKSKLNVHKREKKESQLEVFEEQDSLEKEEEDRMSLNKFTISSC